MAKAKKAHKRPAVRMKIVCPYVSIDLTKGKAYQVLVDFGFGDVIIKNDIGEEIPVASSGSAWTFEMPWKVMT